jgi:type I restriction enzyme, S subunit
MMSKTTLALYSALNLRGVRPMWTSFLESKPCSTICPVFGVHYSSISPCLHQNHIIKVRFEPKEIAQFVLYWLLSDKGREQISRVASSTSGLYTLSLSKVSHLCVPYPPLIIQQKIVAEIERRLSVANQVEAAVEVGLKRGERLRQAVLKAAFEGRL